MKNFVIPPVSALHLSKLGSAGFFALGQLYLKHESYRDYVKACVADGQHVILDSGIGDHAPITQDQLWDLTLQIRPTEVIPLDTLFDKEATIQNLEDFINRLDDVNLLGKIKILGCPQGATKEEWLECYHYMLEHPYVDTIGMSKLAIPKAWLDATDDKSIAEARNACVTDLFFSGHLSKPLHFLGMGEMNEFIYYKELARDNDYLQTVFRSTDSCYSILSAMNGLSWKQQQYDRIPTPRNYFDLEVTSEQELLAKENALVFQQLLDAPEH